ncbi:MAG TPA: hypothetical protein VGP27_16720 [Mycobacterium sp.]|nr:hypothetical protein [Mycobacterium sp.]
MRRPVHERVVGVEGPLVGGFVMGNLARLAEPGPDCGAARGPDAVDGSGALGVGESGGPGWCSRQPGQTTSSAVAGTAKVNLQRAQARSASRRTIAAAVVLKSAAHTAHVTSTTWSGLMPPSSAGAYARPSGTAST